MTPADAWFLVLASVCVAGPYALGVRPKTPRQRQYVALTIAFLAWVLPLMASLREWSRPVAGLEDKSEFAHGDR